MDNLKKYLPSKKFMSLLLIVIIFIVMIFLVKGIVSLFKNINGGKASNGVTEMTVGSIIQKDSNNNDIADWEEYLWGLNPYKNGKENKEFILSKKNALMQSGDIKIPDETESITENEILSREFFATIISLQQTGNLNDESMQSISDAIGQKIEAISIPDIYTKDMIKVEKDSRKTKDDYFIAFMTLAFKYENEDIGKELILISQGLGNNDPQALSAVKSIASAYKSFGSELIKIPVPASASSIHLDLANNYEKTGQSIEGLAEILADPIIGMRAIISYKKYNDAIASDIDELKEVLK